MKKFSLLLLAGILVGCVGVAQKNQTETMNTTSSNDEVFDISMFPETEKDRVQWRIDVPQKENENDYKISLHVGKEMTVDCNNHFLGGEIIEHNLEGWGYNYYTFETKGEVASTLMGCAPNSEKRMRVEAPEKTVRYNSRMPIILYAPEGYEVEFSIWEKGEKNSAQKVS